MIHFSRPGTPESLFFPDSSLIILEVSQEIGDMHGGKRISAVINGKINMILCFICTPVFAISPERTTI